MANIKELHGVNASGADEVIYPVTEASLVGSEHGTIVDEIPYMVSPGVAGVLPADMVPPVYGLQTGVSTRGGGFTMGTSPVMEYAYGVEHDITNSSTSCTRIGNMSLHASLPIQSKMRRCLLKDDGSVNYYLSDTDSTKKGDGTDAVLDGTDGMVMVEIPAHWRRFEQDGNIMRVWLSTVALPGFHFVPKCYRSAYEAAVDRTVSATPKLASVVNTSASFRGGNNNADWDGTYRSLLGMPATTISLTDFRAYARNRGTAGKNGAGWNCDVYDVQKTCWWLYAVEYANFNCQLAYNAEPTSEGYKQGGLGPGVTTLSGSNWSSYNGYCPFVPCGHTNSLGNKTGVVDYAMPDSEGGVFATVSVPSYRGLENPFGHVCSWTDGCKCNIQSADAGGVSEFFVCTDPAKFQSNDYTDYEKRGELPRMRGHIKIMMIGEYGENMPVEVGASTTTYFADYFYTNIAGSTEQRGVLFGGAAAYGADAGFSFVITNYLASATNTAFGSRLCFLPSAEASEWYSPVGVDTAGGYFSNSSPSLSLAGSPKSIAVLLTTGSDVTTTQWFIQVSSNLVGFIGNGQITAMYVPSVEVTPNTTYLWVGVYDPAKSSRISFYLNGVYINSGDSGVDDAARVFSVGLSSNGLYSFLGTIHYSRLFNYALSSDEVAVLWNGGNPSVYVLPNSLKCPVLDFPTSIFTASRNTFTANNPGTVSNITFDVPAANGFSGPFAREEAILRLSTYCAFHNRDTYVDIPIKVKVEYRCNYALYSAREDGVLLLPANEGNAKEATIVYGPGFGYLATPGNVSDGWAEIRVLSIESVGCIAEYLPAGLSATSWAPSVGDASLSATGTPRVVSLPLVGDEVVKTDYWSAFPVNPPYTISIIFKTGSTVYGAPQCLFSSSELSGTGIRVEINANARFQFGVGSNNRLGPTVTSNTLYCLQIVYDGTSVTFYDNGDRSSLPFTDAFTSTTFVLGNYGDGAAPFLGEIVSCHVLSYAVSAADVKALWNEGDPVRSASPLVKFPATSLSGSDFANVVFGPNAVNWAIIGGYYSDYANGFTGRYVRCFSDEDSAGVRRLSVYSTLFAVPVGSRVRLTIKYRSSEQVYWGSYSPGQTLPKNTGAAALATFEFDSPSTGVSVFSGSVLTESGSSSGIPADSFLEVQLVSLEVFGCVSEWRPSGLLGSGLTPAFSKATVTGVSTRSGGMGASDSTLAFSGDRSIEILFTTGDQITNTSAQCVVTDYLGSGSSVFLGISITGTFYLYIGGTIFYLTPSVIYRAGSRYHFVISYAKGSVANVYVNGESHGSVTTFASSENGNGLYLGYLTSTGGNPFLGVVNHARVYNYALSVDDVSALWNSGNPGEYIIPATGTLHEGCVAEYLPDRATVDAWYPSIGSAVLSAVASPRPVGDIVTGASMWQDSSGHGAPALAAVGSPSMSYAPVPAEDEIILDSGYFVTDISTAVKNVFLPQGYVPVSVTVYNGNPSDITNVSVTLGNANRFAVYGATVASGSSVTGYIGNATTGGALLTRIIVNGLTSSFYIGVNATGNTSSGGMRVKVRCRYALGE